MSFQNDFALAEPVPDADSWEAEATDYRWKYGQVIGYYPTEAEAVAAARAALAGGRQWVEVGITNSAYRRWQESRLPSDQRPAEAKSIDFVCEDWLDVVAAGFPEDRRARLAKRVAGRVVPRAAPAGG